MSLKSINSIYSNIDDNDNDNDNDNELNNNKIIKVGVSLLLHNDKYPNCILLGERKGSHGAGTLAPPGGHMEFGEHYFTTAIRELKEETNLDIVENNIKFLTITNDIIDDRHYITIFLSVCIENVDNLKLCEPDKCVSWNWIDFKLDINAYDKELFLPMKNLIEFLKINKDYLRKNLLHNKSSINSL